MCRIYFYVAILGLTISTCVTNLSAQSIRTRVIDQRVSIKMKSKPFYTVIGHLIQKYDVAVGLEESVNDAASWNNFFEVNKVADYEKTFESGKFEFRSSYNPSDVDKFISVDFTDARLEDVMNEIVSQMNGYQWSVQDDVINIVPKVGRDVRLKELCETKIKRFGSMAGNDIDSIAYILEVATPEFQEFLSRNKLLLNSRMLSDEGSEKLTSTIDLNDIKFIDLLNRVTKVKRGGWILKIWSGASKGTQDLFQIVI